MTIFSIFIMVALHLGGGLGLSYSGVFLLGNLSLSLVFYVTGSICANIR